MTGATLKGLYWGHRRATGPLDALARDLRASHGIKIEWARQTLAGFEHQFGPVIVDAVDLVVFDHPYIGSVASEGLLLPLDEALGALNAADFVGRSLDSYRYDGTLWALPIDGATQVAAYRADLLDARPVPATWSEVLNLGREARRRGRWLGLATLNPHGYLVLAALMANLGRPFATDPRADLFHGSTLSEALGHLREVLAFAHPDGRAQNAIDLHELMAGGDAVVYAPLVYAYYTYGEAGGGARLSFADVALPGPVPRAGTVLGGTGLGITRSCRNRDAAAKAVRRLTTGAAQTELIAGHHGQPAHVLPWSDAAVDARFGGAYTATLATMEQAWTRARVPGSIAFQHRVGAIVEAFCRGEVATGAVPPLLEAAWATTRVRRALPVTGVAQPLRHVAEDRAV